MSAESASEVWKRTHYAGDLRAAHEGQDVVLCGWVQKSRDMGHLVFVDIRDREGLAQVVFQSDKPELMEEAKKIRNEYVVGVRGRIRHRSAVNPDMPTGEVEVEAIALHVFAVAKLPPFQITDPPQASEELRLKYRYLDLRPPWPSAIT
jgi:aspartyl-tRNA synthetase